MGKQQKTCGVVTGSYMVLGIFSSQKAAEETNINAETELMVKKFTDKFTTLQGATDCMELVKCDISTTKGLLSFRENNLKGKVCEKCMEDAVRIVDELIEI